MKSQRITDRDAVLLSQYGLDGLDLSRAARHVYAQDEYLSHAGEPIDSIYFVVSGKAKVYVSLPSGKELLLAYFTSKGIIGEFELVNGRPANCTAVQAMTEFICVVLPLAVYADELKNNNTFINYIARTLADKLIQRVINGAITALQPLEARLCAYIAQAAIDGLFRDKLTETAIAVGAGYRHMLRCIDKLCEKGILRKELSGYRVVNQKALEETAGEQMYSL